MAQKSLETKKKEDSKAWYKDPFVKRVIVVLLSLMAISVIAGIVLIIPQWGGACNVGDYRGLSGKCNVWDSRRRRWG